MQRESSDPIELIVATNALSSLLGPERLTKQGGSHENYSDAVPFMKRLVDAYPDRVLWGTDWPHPNRKSHVPDDGQAVGLTPLIADTEENRQ